MGPFEHKRCSAGGSQPQTMPGIGTDTCLSHATAFREFTEVDTEVLPKQQDPKAGPKGTT
jgi:hypothetical protein